MTKENKTIDTDLFFGFKLDNKPKVGDIINRTVHEKSETLLVSAISSKVGEILLTERASNNRIYRELVEYDSKNNSLGSIIENSYLDKSIKIYNLYDKQLKGAGQ